MLHRAVYVRGASADSMHQLGDERTHVSKGIKRLSDLRLAPSRISAHLERVRALRLTRGLSPSSLTHAATAPEMADRLVYGAAGAGAATRKGVAASSASASCSRCGIGWGSGANRGTEPGRALFARSRSLSRIYKTIKQRAR